MVILVKDRRTLRLRNVLELIRLDVVTMGPAWRRQQVLRLIDDTLRADAETKPEV